MEENKIEEQEIQTSDVLIYVTKYLETFNKTDAYLAVHPDSSRGAAMSNTWRYWNNKKVQAALAHILEDSLMGTDEIRATLTALARGGNGVKKAEQLKAIELIMKSKGMFIERMDITTAGKSLSWEQIISENRVDTKNNFGGMTVLG